LYVSAVHRSTNSRCFLPCALWERSMDLFRWFTLIVISTRFSLLKALLTERWSPRAYPSIWTSTQSDFTHGTMFWYGAYENVPDNRMANEEGLIANGTSIHAGLRTRLWGKTFSDYDHDEKVGFVYIETDGMNLSSQSYERYRCPWNTRHCRRNCQDCRDYKPGLSQHRHRRD